MTLLRVLHPYLYVTVPILPNALLPYVQAPDACAYLKLQRIRVPVCTIIAPALPCTRTSTNTQIRYSYYRMYRRQMRARTCTYTEYAYRLVPSSKQDSRIILRNDATTVRVLHSYGYVPSPIFLYYRMYRRQMRART